MSKLLTSRESVSEPMDRKRTPADPAEQGELRYTISFDALPEGMTAEDIEDLKARIHNRLNEHIWPQLAGRSTTPQLLNEGHRLAGEYLREHYGEWRPKIVMSPLHPPERFDGTIVLSVERRERLPNGDWSDWHPANLTNPTEGLEHSQEHEFRVNRNMSDWRQVED